MAGRQDAGFFLSRSSCKSCRKLFAFPPAALRLPMGHEQEYEYEYEHEHEHEYEDWLIADG
jgi:hypothetical protein